MTVSLFAILPSNVRIDINIFIFRPSLAVWSNSFSHGVSKSSRTAPRLSLSLHSARCANSVSSLCVYEAHHHSHFVSGGGLGTSIAVGMIPEFAQFQKFEVIVIVWLAFSAVADCVITIALVWHLVCS